jgi:hypothetical protein
MEDLRVVGIQLDLRHFDLLTRAREEQRRAIAMPSEHR